jgi:hypothetical protein
MDALHPVIATVSNLPRSTHAKPPFSRARQFNAQTWLMLTLTTDLFKFAGSCRANAPPSVVALQRTNVERWMVHEPVPLINSAPPFSAVHPLNAQSVICFEPATITLQWAVRFPGESWQLLAL